MHGAWGLSPWEGRPLPLEERDLPSSYVQLDEAEQERVADAALTVLFDWARGVGCTHVRAEVPLEPDLQALTNAGLRAHDGGVEGDFSSEVGQALQMVGLPERVWVRRHDALVIYVHETWDSVVVTADKAAIDDLAGQLARAVTY